MTTAAIPFGEVLSGEALWSIQQGDCLEIMKQLPDACVDLVVASPPYERARTYLENGEDMGIARDTEEWVSWMVEVCRAARRVCKGLCAFVVEGQTRDFRYTCSPDLLRADLHRAGFHMRKSPIYKRVGIPGSGGPDWLRNDYEPIVCFTKGGKLPWSDNCACGHPPKWAPGGEMSYRRADGKRMNAVPKIEARNGDLVSRKNLGCHSIHKSNSKRRPDKNRNQESDCYVPPNVANPGNVIECLAGGGRLGSSLAHENEAPFSEKLCEFFIRSFCPPGGIVLDPFAGSGTSLAVAIRHGRRALGIDVRASQVELTRKRVSLETRPLFGEL